MTTFIIPVHSFVDLITNSSSELFVCNTNKSVDSVKEVLVELAKAHNARRALYPKDGYYRLLDIDRLFEDVFSDPYVSDGSDEDVYSTKVANKGDIIISSATDNSIPYDMFDDIANIFGARRYHLG